MDDLDLTPEKQRILAQVGLHSVYDNQTPQLTAVLIKVLRTRPIDY